MPASKENISAATKNATYIPCQAMTAAALSITAPLPSKSTPGKVDKKSGAGRRHSKRSGVPATEDETSTCPAVRTQRKV